MEKAPAALRPVMDAAAANSPKLLLVAGIGGFVATVAITARNSAKAKEVHADFSEARKSEEDEKARRKLYVDEAKALAPHVLPILFTGAASVLCFVGSSSVQAKRSAAVLAAYTALEKTVEANQDVIVEKLGLEKAGDILEEADRRASDAQGEPPDDSGGWFKDYLTGRYFKCDEATLRMAESTVNKRLNSEVTVPLKEFYYEVGLEDDTPIGDIFGFESGRCPLDVHFLTVHPGTPMEYRQVCYRYVMVNRSLVGA